ncbi:hypothetical protein N0V93_001431 [Gnomoniopsis smithogilvyi]|uniref:Uncharacterized protein n=1 Tax=Gnomoniopsis smithogilvyi TaxID=1191159 RepID=A0A9W8Z1M8_9PEZI|nr:hypothetical protein N0V93_001431 [Gnomoniopsis smithogilvyi]
MTIPESQTDRHANHGSAPASPPPPSNDDDSSYDFKRPTKPDEAGYPPADPAGADGEAQHAIPKPKPDCPPFEKHMRTKPGPPSAGHRQFPLVRPPPECRTYPVPAVDAYIEKMETKIKDPDLYRLFQNSFPNTLDTMVKWHGFAQDADGNATTEELSYIITGDIDAMWLRDSASQLYSYLPFLSASSTEFNDDIKSLNSLWRGLINSHARYIIISPYCHSFQPPPESGIPPTTNGAYKLNNPRPAYDPSKVFDCKWELDSLASFLQVSVGYWTHTHDLAFFARYNWIEAVKAAVDAAAAMRIGTYDEEGRVLPSAWTFTGWTNRGSETLTNDGIGNPVRTNGMVRTAFRPSDDATIFQLLVPANMMWAKYLEEASVMMEELAEGAVHPIDKEKQAMAKDLIQSMRDLAFGIRKGIDADGIVTHKEFGEIFAYECDGYGGVNLMDDANVPSLLSMPLFKYTESRYPLPADATKRDYNKIYQNTRRFAMSAANPYWAQGPAISAVGGPHLGPGKAWPMAALVAGMTAFDAPSGLVDSRGKNIQGSETELVSFVSEQLGMVLNSTSGWGIVHESVNSWQEQSFTRAWFGWANGLLGELIGRMEAWEERNLKVIVAGGGEGLLEKSWQ